MNNKENFHNKNFLLDRKVSPQNIIVAVRGQILYFSLFRGTVGLSRSIKLQKAQIVPVVSHSFEI